MDSADDCSTSCGPFCVPRNTVTSETTNYRLACAKLGVLQAHGPSNPFQQSTFQRSTFQQYTFQQSTFSTIRSFQQYTIFNKIPFSTKYHFQQSTFQRSTFQQSTIFNSQPFQNLPFQNLPFLHSISTTVSKSIPLQQPTTQFTTQQLTPVRQNSTTPIRQNSTAHSALYINCK